MLVLMHPHGMTNGWGTTVLWTLQEVISILVEFQKEEEREKLFSVCLLATDLENYFTSINNFLCVHGAIEVFRTLQVQWKQ